MKQLLLSAAIIAMCGTSAMAQDAKAKAVSQSAAGAISGSYAATGSNSATLGVLIDQRAPGQQTIITEQRGGTRAIIEQRGGTNSTLNTNQSGTIRSEFAPAVNAPAFSSGHPCGLADSLGISIIGGGLTGGSTHVDDACLLAQMGEGRAAIAIIAGRNGVACRALRNNGRISDNSRCPGDPRNETSVEPVAVAATPASVCQLKPGTTRTVQVRGMSNNECVTILRQRGDL